MFDIEHAPTRLGRGGSGHVSSRRLGFGGAAQRDGRYDHNVTTAPRTESTQSFDTQSQHMKDSDDLTDSDSRDGNETQGKVCLRVY